MWTATIGVSVFAIACHGGSSANPSPSPSPSASSTPTPAQGAPALTELDVSGNTTRHVHLAGSQKGRLQTMSAFTFTFSQLSDQSDSGTTAEVFSLQGLVKIEVGETVHIPGHLRVDGMLYAGDDCTLVIKSQGPPDGPAHTRWLEGTFSCSEMIGPGDKKVTVTNGHFAGRFEDHRLPT